MPAILRCHPPQPLLRIAFIAGAAKAIQIPGKSKSNIVVIPAKREALSNTR